MGETSSGQKSAGKRLAGKRQAQKRPIGKKPNTNINCDVQKKKTRRSLSGGQLMNACVQKSMNNS